MSVKRDESTGLDGSGRAGVRPGPLTEVPRRLEWLDPLRALAILMIVSVHVVEQIFAAGMFAGNPNAAWGTAADRFAQWLPLGGFGVWDPIVNLTRWLGWLGDHGVSLFIIASGAALTWSAYSRPGPQRYWVFLRRRARRLYPLWLGSHVLLLLAIWAGATRFSTGPFVLSVLGLRVTPASYYYGVPAWWYFTLAITLSALFPPLLVLLRRMGPARFVVVVGGAALVVRLVGLELLAGTDWVDLWSRGAIGITRLPEFVLGMAAAAAWFGDPEHATNLVRRPRSRVIFAVLVVAGLLASFSLVGMTVAYLLVGGGVSGLVAGVDWSRRSARFSRSVGWIGKHSYAIFLTHQVVILALVPRGLDHGLRTVVAVVLALLVTVVLTLALERAVDLAGRFAGRLRARRGPRLGGAIAIATALALLLVVPLADLTVRRLDPREAKGWGERPSLVADPEVGWKLRPSSVTRLRWNSYDYTVTANSLGYPGPDVPVERSQDTLRIMTVGDAYTSAEGVDTPQSWPRLLQDQLRRSTGRDVQVQNFAITGYGPNQYLSVLQKYVPIYRPDLVIVAMSFTDFDDVETADADFQEGIGFGRPPAQGIDSLLSGDQIRQWAKEQYSAAVNAVTGKPNSTGYFFGGFSGLDVTRRPELERGALDAADRLAKIRALAGQYGAQLSVLMIPPPASVCTSAELSYFPAHVDLADRAAFDVSQTSELTARMATRAGLPVHDLTQALKAAPAGCPYMPNNLHWTLDGQAAAAQIVSHLPELAPLTDRKG